MTDVCKKKENNGGTGVMENLRRESHSILVEYLTGEEGKWRKSL